MSAPDLGFVRLAEGLRLRYRCLGDDGPTVLLLHGWPQTGYVWRRLMPTLAASGYVTVAPDLRGCGDSDKPTGGYDVQTRTEDMRELASILGLADEPLFLAGHGDEGAEIALSYAQSYPDEVAGIVLLGAAPGLLPPTASWHKPFHQTPDLPELLLAPHLDTYLRHFFHAWAHDPQMLNEDDLALYVQSLSQPGALRASLAPFRAPAAAPAAPPPVPTLLLLGESDPHMNLASVRETLAALGNPVDVETIPRGGYWLPEERPDPVAAALLTFFRTHQGSTPMLLPPPPLPGQDAGGPI